jgi:4-diphosphocytidyl-2-C-methyl-D-erythritol kinase
MRLNRTTTDWVADTPAKLNVFFEVLAARPDGYHEIETLMCPIDLYDTLCFRANSSGAIELTCDWMLGGDASLAMPPGFPLGRENLVYRAIDLLRRRAGISAGASVRLIKRIPTEAGLGGGSSDAAAALCVASHAWELGWSTSQLMELAAELGSDVPFFLVGGPAVCRGRGERVEAIAGLGMLHFVVVRPPEGLSTAAVYRACRPAERPADVRPMLAALHEGRWHDAGGQLLNRLQPAAERLSPWIERMRCEFAGFDLLGHAMSGSGTSYFGLCRHARHARRIARHLQARGYQSVYAVKSCL